MNKVIGLKIKELRKEKKLTQKMFSAEIGIDDSQLSKIEQGKLMPTLMQLLEISSIFKISLDWLTGQGSMLKETVPPAISSSQPQENDKYTASLEKQVAQLEKINTLQEEKIKGLEQEVAQLKEDLELYIANSSGDILRSNAG